LGKRELPRTLRCGKFEGSLLELPLEYGPFLLSVFVLFDHFIGGLKNHPHASIQGIGDPQEGRKAPTRVGRLFEPRDSGLLHVRSFRQIKLPHPLSVAQIANLLGDVLLSAGPEKLAPKGPIFKALSKAKSTNG
jgi:hypothetical protein